MKKILPLFKKLGLVLAAILLIAFANRSFGQVTGDYRSNVANGNWNTLGNWQRWSGTAWVTVTTGNGYGYPGQNAASSTANVYIVQGDNITLNVSPAYNIASLQLGTTSITIGVGKGTLTFGNGGPYTLNITGAVTLGVAGSNDNGTITMTNGGTLGCGSIVDTYNGSGSPSVWTSGSGTLQLSNTNTLPGTATFATYNNLIVNGGTTSLGQAITVKSTITLTSGTLNVSASNFSISIAGNWTNNGGTFTAGTGTVNFNSTTAAQTMNAGASNPFYNLTISNSHGVSLSSGAAVSNQLLLTSGVLTTTSQVLSVTNTANTGISGGSAAAYINGPVSWSMPGSSSTTYIFPVGSGTSTYLPFAITNPGGTSSVATVQAIIPNANSGYDNTLSGVSSTEYWTLTYTGTLTGGTVSLAKASLGNYNTVAYSPNGDAGVSATPYTSWGGAINSTLINNNTVTSSTALTVASPLYFALATRTINYYYKGTGNFNSVTSWGTNTDGTGTNPSNFTTSNQVFNIRNGTGIGTLNAAWTVSGTNSKVVVGDGTNNWNFTIPSGAAYTGLIDVSATGTLTIANGSIPNLGTLNASSTVIFNGTTAQTVPSATYGNLTISNSGATATANGALTIAGSVSISSGAAFAGSTYSHTVSGDWTNSGGTYTSGTATVTFNGTGSQTITGSSNFYNLSITNASPATNMNLASGSITGIAGAFTPNGTSFASIAGSTVNFNGTGAQTVPAFNYNSLIISGAHTTNSVTLANGGIIDVAGTFAASATFTSGNYIITNNTFNYNGTGQTISAFNYNNLTNTGNIALAGTGIVGIAGTFTPVGTYTVTGSTVSFNGSAAQAIPAFTFNNLTLNNAAGASLGGAVNVGSTLALTSGVLTLGAYNLTISSGTAIAGGPFSSTLYIKTSGAGQLIQMLGATAMTYPIGNAAYNPITFTNAGVSNSYGVSVTDGAIPNAVDANAGVNEIWNVTAATGGLGNLAVVAQFNQNQEAVGYNSNAGDFIGYYNGTSWTPENAAVAGSNPYTFSSAANFNVNIASSGTQYFAVGTGDCFVGFCAAPGTIGGLLSPTSTITSISATIIPPSPAPAGGYIIFYSLSSAPPSVANGTTYTLGNTYFSNADTVGYVGTNTNFTINNLTPGLTYWLFIVSYNPGTGTCNGPVYSPVFSLSFATKDGSYATDQFQTNSGNITNNGEWSTSSNWQSRHGSAGTWITATLSPGSQASSITILGTDLIAVGTTSNANESVTGSNVTVTGELDIDQGATFTINHTGSADMTVSGTLNNASTIAEATSATLTFSSTASYIHSQDGGTVPIATWNVSSTLNITGVVSNTPTGLSGQVFGNVVWNCASQSQEATLDNDIPGQIAGNLTVSSTGASDLSIANINASTLNVAGNLVVSGGNFYTDDYEVANTLNVNGNITISGGSFGPQGGNADIINVRGNWTLQSAGSYISSGTETVNFNSGSASQTINSDVSNQINFGILEISTISSSSTVLGNNIMAGTISISSNSTFDISTFNVTGNGSGNLNLYSGSVLKLSGASNFPPNAQAFPNTGYNFSNTIDPASTVWYYGGNQTVAGGLSCGILTLSNNAGGTVRKSLSSLIHIQKNLNIQSNTIFDVGKYAANCSGSQSFSSGSTSTIVNYDFNSGNSYGSLVNHGTDPNVSCSVSGSSSAGFASSTSISTATDANAFTQNSVAGNSIYVQPTIPTFLFGNIYPNNTPSYNSGNTYWQFNLSGSSLNTYTNFKIYFQYNMPSIGGLIKGDIAVYYSTDGGNTYNSVGGDIAVNNPGWTTFADYPFSLALTNLTQLQILIVANSNTTTTANVYLDNFQVQASTSGSSTLTYGSLSISPNGKLMVGSYNGGLAQPGNTAIGSNFPGGFATYSLDPASTVEYYAAVSPYTTAQTVYSPLTYGNLTLSNYTGAAGVTALPKKITSSITGIAGNFTINDSVKFDMGTYSANYTGTGTPGSTMSVKGTYGYLKLAGISGGISGSNFPNGFSTYVLSPSSTVEYYGSGATQNQTVALVPGTSQTTGTNGSATGTGGYGNLIIGDATNPQPNTIATAGGNLNIQTNLLINSKATFSGSSYFHTVGSNWTNNGTFTGGTSTVTLDGTSLTTAQTIGGSASTTFTGLAINNSGKGVTLIDPSNSKINKTVAGPLTLSSGLIATDSLDLLILSSSATVSVPSPYGVNLAASTNYYNNPSYVNGPMVDTVGTNAGTTYTFPIGKAGTGYMPITISGVANANGPQAFGAEYYHISAETFGPIGAANPQLVHVSGCDYWRLELLTPSSGNLTFVNSLSSNQNGALSAGTANITMYWNPNSSASPCINTNGTAVPFSQYVTNTNDLAIGHLQFVGGQSYKGLWYPVAPASGTYSFGGTLTNGSISYVGINTFSPFSLATINGADNPLPILLDYFTATKANGYNKLTWKAECTDASSGFVLQRSQDGVHWTDIDSVQINNPTDCSVPFNYNDYTSTGSRVYYRVEMVDVNANVTYSEIRLILNDANSFEILSIYPNPAQSSAWLSISASQSQLLELVLYSIDGKEIQRKTVQLLAGSNTISLYTDGLASGTYLVRGLFSNGQTNTLKFIKN